MILPLVVSILLPNSFLCPLQSDEVAPKVAGYNLVFDDEFNKPGLPDPEKWSYEVGMIRNHEAQYYTDGRPENFSIEDGTLTIEARNEKYKGADYTSGSIRTKGKFSFTYGLIEMRAKLPQAMGTWPAFWMLANNSQQNGWLRKREIDIMEHVQFEPATIFGTVHMEVGPSKHFSKGGTLKLADNGAGWHTYGLNWKKDSLDFLVDGKVYFSYRKSDQNPWPFDKPMYLIVNLAIGGSWGGEKGIDASAFPQKYQIDYVRVYQANK